MGGGRLTHTEITEAMTADFALVEKMPFLLSTVQIVGPTIVEHTMYPETYPDKENSITSLVWLINS
jgi:hypothetical protein